MKETNSFHLTLVDSYVNLYLYQLALDMNMLYFSKSGTESAKGNHGQSDFSLQPAWLSL
jgi:hypothetical protein